MHNTIQYNSLHRTSPAQCSRQPDGRTSTASLTAHPRHTQSHTLGHWTPHSGSRSGVTQGGPNHTEERGRGGHTHTKSARRLVAPLMRDAPLPHRDMHATRSRVAQAGSHQAARHGSASPTATSPSRKSGADWHCTMHTHRRDIVGGLRSLYRAPQWSTPNFTAPLRGPIQPWLPNPPEDPFLV